jgi:hypothetical protein
VAFSQVARKIGKMGLALCRVKPAANRVSQTSGSSANVATNSVENSVARNERLMKNLFFLVLLGCCRPDFLSADQLWLQLGEEQRELVGQVVLEGQDNSLLFLEQDGRYWFVQPDQIVRLQRTEIAPPAIDRKDLRMQLATELGESFQFHETRHYLIAYQTETAYARWVGGLFEARLYQGFERFWRRKKFPLQNPAYPLVVMVFRSKTEYEEHLQREFGQIPEMVAYYNLLTNRVAMYDLTQLAGEPVAGNPERKLQQVLQNPAILPMIATMIHEGTHQLIFNRGLQNRFSGNPLWLNEGLAVYFETPNPSNRNGWTEPGLVSLSRLNDFQRNSANRSPQLLQQLVASDDLLIQDETAVAAYAEAWVLVSFLLARRSDQFIEYLKQAGARQVLQLDTPEQRLAEFEQYFGNDWSGLERESRNFANQLAAQSQR